MYPVNNSQSFVGAILNSASKSTLGKTLPSQSMNLDVTRNIAEKFINSNRTTMSVVDARKS